MAYKSCISIYFLLSILLSENGIAQSISWQRTYDGPFQGINVYFESACASQDGNLFIGGRHSGFYILKINPYGDTIWTKWIGDAEGAYAILPVYDGGCIFTGGNDTACSIRLGPTGNIIWYKTYPVNNSFQYAQLYDMAKTSDGGYIMCGNIFSPSAGCIYKIDSLGNLQWSKIHFAPFIRTYRNLVEIAGGYLVGGFEDNGNYAKTILIKLNYLGDTLWQREYTLNNNAIDPENIFYDGNKIIFFATAYDFVLSRAFNCYLKLDTSGNVLDSVFINSPPPLNKSDIIYDVKKINDDKYLLSCLRYRYSGTDTGYAESKIIDSLGNIIYYKSFLGFEWSELHSCITAGNGDFLFVGYASRFNQFDFDGYAVRTDSMLNTPPFGIEPIGSAIPKKFYLYQNYPNPFNPVTKIKFTIPYRSFVKLITYDLLGREVSEPVNQLMTPGSYEVTFDGANYASGIYFYSLETRDFKVTRKMVLVK